MRLLVICKTFLGFAAAYWLLLIVSALLRYQVWKWQVR